jgi:xanthine dehydrogenase accessory factor
MKEIADLLQAYQTAKKQNIKAALATVVKVEGSSYRRPGARMLVTEDGRLTGAISGGCLEGDALKKALSAIYQQENKLVTYDTTDEDDAKFGVQLGCNGIVHILFEPLNATTEPDPIAILKAFEAERENAVLVTLFSTEHSTQLGTTMIYRKNKLLGALPLGIQTAIMGDVKAAFENKTTEFRIYSGDRQPVEAFIEFLSPAIALVIAGAGNDVQPLADMAHILGWHVHIADGRPTHASLQRFPNAQRVIIAKPAQLMTQVVVDEQTAFVLMTHNYNYDLELLNLLLATDAVYIGVLGPKKKLIRMLDELDRNTAENRSRIHGPIGLDIGAETAEEIAISILAEIKSVFSKASGASLKEKTNPIHIHNSSAI